MTKDLAARVLEWGPTSKPAAVLEGFQCMFIVVFERVSSAIGPETDTL